jgi:hypothetical protein
MQIYLGKNGEKRGPFSPEEVKAKLTNGQISTFDLAWHEGMTEWKPLGSLAGIAANGDTSPPPVMASALPQNSPLAAVSMVTGIVGLPLALVCGIFGFIAPVTAIVCGHLASSQIKKSNGTVSGKGMALAGLILGYAAVALYVLIVVGTIGLVAYGVWRGSHH